MRDHDCELLAEKVRSGWKTSKRDCNPSDELSLRYSRNKTVDDDEDFQVERRGSEGYFNLFGSNRPRGT